jgi:hypothetical protein
MGQRDGIIDKLPFVHRSSGRKQQGVKKSKSLRGGGGV